MPRATGLGRNTEPWHLHLSASFLPALPVYGFTLPLLLKLSFFVPLGFVACDGATYVPFFFVYPRTEWTPDEEATWLLDAWLLDARPPEEWPPDECPPPPRAKDGNVAVAKVIVVTATIRNFFMLSPCRAPSRAHGAAVIGARSMRAMELK